MFRTGPRFIKTPFYVMAIWVTCRLRSPRGKTGPQWSGNGLPGTDPKGTARSMRFIKAGDALNGISIASFMPN